jgi:hypothetical protein
MSAFADQFSLQENGRNVKDFLRYFDMEQNILSIF